MGFILGFKAADYAMSNQARDIRAASVATEALLPLILVTVHGPSQRSSSRYVGGVNEASLTCGGAEMFGRKDSKTGIDYVGGPPINYRTGSSSNEYK